jgi:Putative Ig domain
LAFGATGGTPPYTWSATGLPAGVTINSTGTLSGTPTAIGTSSITVTVKDSAGLTTSETLNLTVALPAAPAVTLTGLPATANAGTQSTASVTFNGTYPVDVTVNLTLTFTPLSGADDPNIQFSTGGRTSTLTIKAGTTTSAATIGVQTGTVAGTITITTQLMASGQDITPVPAPTKTIVIGPAAPSITSVAASVNSTGFTVTIDGFDPTRAVTQVVFTFASAAGSTLQTSSATVSAASLFTSWYQSSASTAFGSQFSFTIPFTVTGNVQSLTSVTVTLVNPTGTSTASTSTL